jgi:hypothetical protein
MPASSQAFFLVVEKREPHHADNRAGNVKGK